MNLIVAVDKNWAIGMDNKLLVSIPQDMKFFRETTKGKVVAMGRKTLESFPGGQPLKNRVNVVLTSDKKYNVKGTVVVHSIDEMVEELKKYNAYQADTFFPDLDQDPQWQMTKISDEQTYFDLEYVFTIYERVS